MLEFSTKWDLLEHLGKDRKDVRYVDRLMLKWVVEKKEWKYILHDPKQEEIARQQEEIERLKKVIDKLEMDNESLEILIRDLEEQKDKWEEQKEKKSEKVDDKISSSSTSSSINSEKSDLEFAIEEYDRISSVLVSSMKKCYNIFIQMKKIDPNQESFEVFYKWMTWESLNH